MNCATFERIANLLAKEHKISIKEGNSWASNIKTKEIFYNRRDIRVLADDHIIGLLLHELAHLKYTHEVDYPSENHELLRTTINMLEDVAVESIIGRDYPNAKEILSSTENEVLDAMVKILPDLDESIQEKSLHHSATRFRRPNCLSKNTAYENVGDEIAKLMVQRKNEIYGRGKTSDLLPLAKSIVEIILKRFGQPSTEQKEKMLMEANRQINANSSQDQQQIRARLIRELGGKGFKSGNCNMTEPRAKFVDKIADRAISVGKKLRKILKKNNSTEFGGRYRSGKILSKRLTRMRILKDRRAFARRVVRSNKSFAFAIASDISGSMWGGGYGYRNSDCALSSIHMIAEALRIAGVPRSMILFGSRPKVAVPMTRKAIQWLELASDKNVKAAGQNSTDIASAIYSCVDQLRQIKAERRILIILTDGAADESEMRIAHKKAESEGIECVGITLNGGCHNRLSNVFRDKRNIDVSNTGNADAICKAFTKVLEQTITVSP